MDILVQVVIGVVGSVLAAVLIAFFPRILRLLGRGNRDISGLWDYYTYEAGQVSHRPRHRSGTMQIRQWGSFVWLSLVLDKRRDGTSYGAGNERKFALKGRWRHDEMLIRFVDERARHQSGAMGMHWRGGELVGKTMYVESDRYQASAAGADSDWITVHGVRLKRPTSRAT